MTWIKCSERMPPDGDAPRYLCYGGFSIDTLRGIDNFTVECCRYIMGGWKDCEHYLDFNASHWQELPEPPEAE